MPDELRTSLWNALHLSLWDSPGFMHGKPEGRIGAFAKNMWYEHFKVPFSQIPEYPRLILSALENYFLKCEWNEVYDFIESVLKFCRSDVISTKLNEVLEREMAAYRIIGGHVDY